MLLVDLVYVADQDKFFDTASGRLIAESTALDRLMSSDPARFPSRSAAMIELDTLRAMPSSHQQVKEAVVQQRKYQKLAQKKSEKIDFEKVYEEAQDFLPYRFYVNEKGTRVVYYISQRNEATSLHDDKPETILNHMLRDLDMEKGLEATYNDSPFLGDEGRFKFTYIKYKEHLIEQLMSDSTKQLDNHPVPISWDPDVITFMRFDATRIKPGDTPTWDQFLSRLDFPEIFMSWVYCLINPDNRIRQVLWLHGAGFDGKSSAMKAIANYLGPEHYAAVQDGAENTNWFNELVHGKRFVFNADAQNMNILRNSRVKAATGGDIVQVEGKGRTSFSAKINAMFAFCSNPMPQIDLFDTSLRTRFIKLEVAKLEDKPDYKFEERLLAECPHFFYKCQQVADKYLDAGRTRLELPAELELVIEQDCASSDYNLMTDFIESKLEFGDGYYIKRIDFQRLLQEHLAQYDQGRRVNMFVDSLRSRLRVRYGVLEQRRLLTIDSKDRTNLFVNVRRKGDITCLSPEISSDSCLTQAN